MLMMLSIIARYLCLQHSASPLIGPTYWQVISKRGCGEGAEQSKS